MKHLITTEQITRAELEELLQLTDDIVKNPKKYADSLRGKVIATIFYEPSTRTRLSFESAIARLGAQVISTENARESASATKGESIEDTVRVLSGYADAIVMRHGDNDSAIVAGRVSSVPIINAGSGSFAHPTQALLDAYTIKRQRGSLENLKLVVAGDLKFGRTANSLIKLMSLYRGMQVYSLSKVGMGLTDDVLDFMRKKGIRHTVCLDWNEVPSDVDVIYQTRIQKERHEVIAVGAEKKDAGLMVITKKVMQRFSKNTYIMHPLPRVDEIATEVDDDPRAIYFEQAHNGVPMRMAILIKALEGK